MKYYIHTFGCQSNKSDSERLAGDYQARGYLPAKSFKTADEIVINTCSIRQSAEDRALGYLKNLKKYFNASHKRKPKIILTGCITHLANKILLKKFSFVDQILPINEVGFNQTAIRRDKIHAWVPISSGCNSFCTYCIVPFSRGREKSRPLTDILTEVKTLAHKGYREITLLGMNVNSYGLEKMGISLRKMMLSLDQPFNLITLPTNPTQYQIPSAMPPFVTLLQAISKIKSVKTIRFMTSNPWDFHDQLIDEIAHNPKIDRFLHIPIQSGSNRILKLMNRGYTVNDYQRLITQIRSKIPNCTIGTDIIVGFPTETNDDFNQTVVFAKKINWQVAFIAKYSPRPGTASAKLYPDDVSYLEKKRRFQILDQLINHNPASKRPTIVH